MGTRKEATSWSDVKPRLVDFDRAGLLRLVQDLYAASKDNQALLHARLALGSDSLKPYKASVDRWLWPDVFKNQDVSVSKANKAISDYKKAIGQFEGMAELMVFYCERAAGFSNDVGQQEEAYLHALERMFQQALKVIASLPEGHRPALWERLHHVRRICHNLGHGVGEAMDVLLTAHGADD